MLPVTLFLLGRRSKQSDKLVQGRDQLLESWGVSGIGAGAEIGKHGLSDVLSHLPSIPLSISIAQTAGRVCSDAAWQP